MSGASTTGSRGSPESHTLIHVLKFHHLYSQSPADGVPPERAAIIPFVNMCTPRLSPAWRELLSPILEYGEDKAQGACRV